MNRCNDHPQAPGYDAPAMLATTPPSGAGDRFIDPTQPPSPQCLAVMYHYVRDTNRSADGGVRGLTGLELQSQIDGLCREMEPIDWPQLYAWLHGDGSIPSRCFLLTFDDGLADHAETVLPILEKRGLHGVFFVSGAPLLEGRLLCAHAIHLLLGRLGDEVMADAVHRQLFDCDGGSQWLAACDTTSAEAVYHYEPPVRARLKYLLNMVLPPEVRQAIVDALFEQHIGSCKRWAKHWYLGWDDLADMQRSGHTIGGHGYAHEPYGRLAPSRRREDVKRVATMLRDAMGADLRPFSYPFGDFDNDTCAACRTAGFVHAFTTQRDWIRGGCDSMRIPRIDTIHVDSFLSEQRSCARS